jgi:tetratricopeptide (TPR) repeat protein
VIFYLESSLKAFDEVPTYRSTPNYTRLRFLLADAYQQVAATEMVKLLNDQTMTPETRRHREEMQRLYLQKASSEFAGLDKYLRSEKGKAHLTPKQRAEVPFLLGSCLFRLGKYAEAVEVYDRIATEYENKIESIVALGEAVRCHASLRQEDKVRQRLLQIEKAIPHVSKEDGQKWKEWVIKARESLTPIRE